MNKLQYPFSDRASEILEGNGMAVFSKVSTASIFSEGIKEEAIGGGYKRLAKESDIFDHIEDNIEYLPVFSFSGMDSKVGEVIFRRNFPKDAGPVSIVFSSDRVSKELTELGNRGMFIKDKADFQAEHTGWVIRGPASFSIPISQDASYKGQVYISDDQISQSPLDFTGRTYLNVSWIKAIKGEKGSEFFRKWPGVLSRNRFIYEC